MRCPGMEDGIHFHLQGCPGAGPGWAWPGVSGKLADHRWPSIDEAQRHICPTLT